MAIKKIPSKILEIKSLTKDTKKFIISTPKNFRFKPGQYILLELKIKNTIQRRAYSIASAPNPKENKIELCIKRIIPKGFANEIFKLKLNSKINFIGPIGNFFIDKKPKKDLIFISVGTGIAPFKSMIEHLLKNLNFKKQIILIQGCRHEKDILYKKFFSDLEKQFPNFKQHIILSKPKKECEFKGHVQNLLNKIVANPKNHNYYICGMNEMLSEVAEKLNFLGVKENQIYFEKYN